MADDSTTLDKIVKAGWLLLEVPFFLPADIATVWLRNSPRTRFIKRMAPWLSCRRYTFNGDAVCWPAKKYEHKRMFRYFVCRHYDYNRGECHHPNYWKPEGR
jgi:hypothetical protein